MASGHHKNGFSNASILNGYLGSGCAEAINYFRGPAATAIINSYFLNDLEVARYERALIILRLQYLDLFRVHYPVSTYCACLRHSNIYFQIGMNCYRFRRQVMENKVSDYIQTSKVLVYLVEMMNYVMRQHLMIWLTCYRCVDFTGSMTSHNCPILQCLAIKYNAPMPILANLIGIPNPHQHHYNMPNPNSPHQNGHI